MVKWGRRNIDMLTIAPPGTTSLMTQTSSGIEPVFMVSYKRRKKINPNDQTVKVSFKDAQKLKGGSELAKKYSLNSLPEFCRNGCRMLTIEASPLDYEQMGPVWGYFSDSGWCRHTLGTNTKVLLVPTGQVEPGNVTTVQQYKSLHVKIPAKMEFSNMSDT